VLETFESVATDIVGDHHGQIVKTIGDEVFFLADNPVEGAEIALGLIEASEQDDRLPPLRVGLAAGPVVMRLGDVFGQTVNIASRLTSLARTGSVLVDQGMADALSGDDRYTLKALRPASVRGYHHLRSWRLRRSQAS
jgi:adenylate cyclase